MPAAYFSRLGVTCFVLDYRVTGDGSNDAWRKPAQDSQRAIRWIRANAASYGLDVDRIGVLGFSAGGQAVAGHITAAHSLYDPIDETDEQSYRPDFRDADLSLANRGSGRKAEADDSSFQGHTASFHHLHPR